MTICNQKAQQIDESKESQNTVFDLIIAWDTMQKVKLRVDV